MVRRWPLTGIDVPVLELIERGAEARVIAGLGPDLCARSGPPAIDAIVSRLLTDPSAALAGALLDQHNVAGFGNVYANELPFMTGVHPFQPVATITRLDELVAIGVSLIRTNADRGVQNTTGRALDTAAHWVYVTDKAAGARRCPICSASLSRCDEPPWGRAVTWCPACQPRAESVAAGTTRARRLLALHPARRHSSFPS